MIMSYPPSGEGSFRSDLLFLLEQLNEELIIELGKPVPGDERLPRRAPSATIGDPLPDLRN